MTKLWLNYGSFFVAKMFYFRFYVDRLHFVQIVTSQFSLALGSDTSKNSAQTKYDFPKLGVKVELPRQVGTIQVCVMHQRTSMIHAIIGFHFLWLWGFL